MRDGLKNPFGPVVGEIMSTFKCSINGGLGECYISTQAVLLRKISFGIELDRDIIPWRAIKSLSHSIDSILVETFNEKTYRLNGIDDLDEKVEAFLSAHEKSGTTSDDKEGIKAAHQLYNRLSLLPSYDQDDASHTVGHTHNDDGVETHNMQSLMKLHEEDDITLSEVVSMNVLIDCDINEFFLLFLSDEAPYSLGHHHERVGDTNVQSTPWHDEKRKILYSHPIHIPGAPSTGAATKTQVMRRFGDHGLCIDTETRITDVPFADCFYVSDRLVATRSNCNKTLLTIKFGLTFEKNTFFRSIISATSVRDVKEFQKGFIATIQRALEDKTSTRISTTKQNICDEIKVSSTKSTHVPENAKLLQSWFFILGLIFSNLYCLNQLQNVNYRLNLLETKIATRTNMKDPFISDECSTE